MTNYSVDDYVTGTGTVEEVAALLETRLETVVTGSGIRLITIIPQGKSKCKGILITDNI